MASPQILIRKYPGKPTRRQQLKMLEYPGRRSGTVPGSFVTDLAEQRAAIVLCSACQNKFNPMAYGFYRTREFRIQGNCDDCGEFSQGLNAPTFFIHESALGRKHGQCWTPR